MFSFRKLAQIGSGLGAIGGVVAYYCFDKNNGTVLASWTTGYVPSGPKWDRNWDMRDPEYLKEPKSGDEEKNGKLKPTAVRHIILIRHGQYNLGGRTDEQCTLTKLGRKQAGMTGERLKALDLPYLRIISSTMTRAKETTHIISDSLPKVPIETSPLLEEGAPIPPEPPIGHWKPPHYQFHQDGARIEAAFRRYFYRADLNQEKDSYEIIVCHANVIRYFVCRALQYPPEGWLRLSLRHASITWLSIMPSGRVMLKCYSEAGYMPPNEMTTS